MLVVRAEEELHDHANIACAMGPDVFGFITKPGQKLLANQARDAGESAHGFFQNVEDRERVLVVGQAIAEGKDKRFVIFERCLFKLAEARGDLTTDVCVGIIKQWEEARLTLSAKLSSRNVRGGHLRDSAAL